MKTTEQRNALVALAYSLLPGLPTIIAGGFAADWTQTRDLDLFVLGDPYLFRAGEMLDEAGIAHQSPIDMDSEAGYIGGGYVVAVVPTPLLPIQIIGVQETSIADLLHTFDISTHRWAWSKAGVRIPGEKATETWETGFVLNNDPTTPQRVARLKARYDIEIEPYTAPKQKKGKVA